MMSKLNLMVCPHDTAKKPERWFRFVQYLNHYLDVGVHLKISLDFNDFHQHLDTADLVYSNPADSLYLVEKKGFSSLVRPTNLYDEVVFIANRDISNPTLESLQGETIATVKSMLPTKVALQMLKAHGISSTPLLDKPSWLSVVNTVSKKEALYGIVYKDTYDELSPKTKEMVNVFAISDERSIFHSINLAATAIAHKRNIEDILLKMNTDAAGKEVLQELNIEGWCAIAPDEMSKIQYIVSLNEL
ncbi:MAG TPA: PhnD/SsuA/transferrin family substrate-binding protein [Stenomitos sp.]